MPARVTPVENSPVVAAGEKNIEFQGWHRIERMLYRDNITAGGNDFTDRTLVEWSVQLQDTYATLSDKIDLVRPTNTAHAGGVHQPDTWHMAPTGADAPSPAVFSVTLALGLCMHALMRVRAYHGAKSCDAW